MVVDCFTFFNEFDVLELRLRTLGEVVDRFVICEAPFTFRGDPKPLYFAAEAERFAAWSDRLRVIALPGPPATDAWANEGAQRSFLASALAECAPGDVILIGDVDEIPDPRLLAQTPAPGRIIAHHMVLMRGYANRADNGGAPAWYGTRALRAGDLAAFGTLNDVRYHPVGDCDVVTGGWHFSSFGGGEVMERKLRSFSHAELDIRYLRDRRRLDVHYEGAGGAAATVEVPAETLPPPLREGARWAPYLWRQTGALAPEHTAQLEHAHGCLAYVPDDATGVAVLTAEPGVWSAAATERLGARFNGVFTSAAALTASAPAWIVVDGLERQPEDVLARLRPAGAGVTAFVRNGRSLDSLTAAREGRPLAPGRALGRSEVEAAARAASFAIAGADRAPTRLMPWTMPAPGARALYQLTAGDFRFPEIEAETLADFQTTAFIFTLTPR